MRHGGDIYRNKVYLDFSVNLNPKEVPETVLRAVRTGIREAGVYPDPEEERVREAIAAADGVGAECIFAGNGASEMILAAVRAFPPRRALLFEPCFSGYRNAMESVGGCEIREEYLRDKTLWDAGGRSGATDGNAINPAFPDEDDFALTEDILRLAGDTDMLFLTDPWNPTGRNIDPGLLERILETASRKNIKVLLDQSFFLLSRSGREWDVSRDREWIRKFRNLIIIRSYTKLFSLPGIRMGYAVSAPENILKIRRQLPEWNLSSVSGRAMEACAVLIAGGVHEIFDYAMMEEERAYLVRGLKDLGCRVYPSDTIYLMFCSVRGLYEKLLERGIMIRDCSGFPGLGEGFYRIAVRKHDENEILLENLREILMGTISMRSL